jgi:hypothetical protein
MRVKPTLQFMVQIFYQLLEEITQFTAQRGASRLKISHVMLFQSSKTLLKLLAGLGICTTAGSTHRNQSPDTKFERSLTKSDTAIRNSAFYKIVLNITHHLKLLAAKELVKSSLCRSC